MKRWGDRESERESKYSRQRIGLTVSIIKGNNKAFENNLHYTDFTKHCHRLFLPDLHSTGKVKDNIIRRGRLFRTQSGFGFANQVRGPGLPRGKETAF